MVDPMIELETEKLFDLCDQDKKGYLVSRDLKAVCPQLDDDEIEFIFMTLDSDGSGRIDRDEFLGGFQNALCQGESNGYPGIKRRASVIEVGRKTSIVRASPPLDLVIDYLTESGGQTDISKSTVSASKSVCKTQEKLYHSDSKATLPVDFNLPCQDEVLQLYEQLQSAGMPQVLSRFEKILGSFCEEIKEQRDQNALLQHVFESERESYNRRMHEVESEIDQHIADTERRTREEERKRFSREKEEMRVRLETEMTELKANIARMKIMEKSVQALRNESNNEVKNKLQDLSQENKVLKSKLAESHLEVAIIKSELASVRADYESKKEEMMSDSSALAESTRQAQNLERQLQLLFDANKRLHDTNDSLREALDLKTARESSCPPERTFRVVMCGDAAVGKSSIVTRIVKGTFPGNLPSTLGVDFHVKATNVDGKNVAVQLWDTAGQERFRSLCKSYFRRADGAILVYDCTVENSFLSVRDWLETIKESTMRQIPVMICGNKIDLRESCILKGVSTENGEAVAAAIGALFAECSALDGTNVEEVLLNLTREMMAREDVEMKSSGAVITPSNSKKASSCCSRS